MQNGARYQAILELITEIFNTSKPADNIINDYLRVRKYIGSKDRRFITESVWDIIRNYHKLAFDAKSREHRRIVLLWLKKHNLLETWEESKYSLSKLIEEEKKWLSEERDEPYPAYVEAECPKWIFDKMPEMEFFKALNQPAFADFRINCSSREQAIERLLAEGIEVIPTNFSPIGIRSENRVSLGNCMTYQDGLIEVQDESSQIAAILAEVKHEHKIIDYCCGAGGKSLAYAYLLKGKGKILAHDIDVKRLENLKPRMKRLNINNIEIADIIATSDKDFDRFIVDAPCSGTGTWRRCPDAKFRLNQQMINKLVNIQKEILDIAYNKTKSGGWIVYMTCSILREENEDVVFSVLNKYHDVKLLNIRNIWERNFDAPYPYVDDFHLRLSPYSSGTDGFFICVLQKN